MKKIQYAAVVISEKSRLQLFEHLKETLDAIPFEYDEFLGDHMTINLGPLKEGDRHLLNQEVKIEVTHFGMSDKCFAVLIGRGGEYSKNEHPHITVAVNRKKGGTSRMSNGLKFKYQMDSILLKGMIAEIAEKSQQRVEKITTMIDGVFRVLL